MKFQTLQLFLFTLLLPILGHSQAATTSIAISGLKDSVTVRRDGRSIPYIEAKTDADLYFVQGYVTASDRLWQMDLMRRLARGETAEIFGKATLEEDKRWRRFGFAKIAEESLLHHSPELRAALDSYAAGVNAYIATLDEKTLPVEFRILQIRPRPWTPADTVVVGKILADALSSTWQRDLVTASMQSLPKDKLAELSNQVTPYDVVLFGKDAKSEPGAVATGLLTGKAIGALVDSRVSAQADLLAQIRKKSLERVGFYAEELAASNNWVISGKRTADGKPILANDPHLDASAPGIWYLTHLSTPLMRISGVTIPGVPGIILGHNEHFAWGATNVGPDVQDLYLETFDDKGNYKTPAGMETAYVRKESVNVRINPLKPDTEAVAFDVTETRNGPIIVENGSKKYALKWTALDRSNIEFQAFYLLNRARNWNEFKNALRTYRGATQNFVYADVKGNIGWYAAGRIPIRKTGNGALPYDGATSDGDWTGFIPFEELPNLYNPAEGFIVTANQRIAGTAYKYPQISRDAASPWRARRLYDILKTDSKITMDAVSAAQHDVFNIPLSNLAKEIVKLRAASADTLAILSSWDGRMTPDSRAALMVNQIRVCAANKIAEDNKPAPGYLIRERILDRAVREESSLWLPKKYPDYAALIKACETEAIDSFSTRFGTDPAKWVWGVFSAARFRHPLTAAPLIGGQFATPTIGLSGSGQTPNVASFVSMRHVASPGNWDATRHVIPLGQSGNPQSPHYKDQFESWRTGSPQIFPFSKQAVEKAAKDLTVFSPNQNRER